MTIESLRKETLRIWSEIDRCEGCATDERLCETHLKQLDDAEEKIDALWAAAPSRGTLADIP